MIMAYHDRKAYFKFPTTTMLFPGEMTITLPFPFLCCEPCDLQKASRATVAVWLSIGGLFVKQDSQR